MLRTSAQRKALCTECPVARVADLVGDTQSILIIRDLLNGPKRFGELEESLKMSTRTLALKLKNLKLCGFLRRSPALAYALTPKGKALKPVIDSLRRYGEKYLYVC